MSLILSVNGLLEMIFLQNDILSMRTGLNMTIPQGVKPKETHDEQGDGERTKCNR